MSLYEWLPKYSTSIRAIDNDHKDLFAAINTFFLAHQRGEGAAQVAATIDCLLKYVDEHFQREERFLEQANYPELESHRRAHANFTGMIRGLHKIYSDDPLAVNVPKVLNFLSDWLAQHILKTDMKYVPYLTGEKHSDDDRQLKDKKPSMTTIQVPDDMASLVREFVEVISMDSYKKAELEETMRKVSDHRDQEMLEQAKKLFCG